MKYQHLAKRILQIKREGQVDNYINSVTTTFRVQFHYYLLHSYPMVSTFQLLFLFISKERKQCRAEPAFQSQGVR